jgi:hypothetical protein
MQENVAKNLRRAAEDGKPIVKASPISIERRNGSKRGDN